MKKILSFLSYHNAVPFIGIALFVGASATFAATTGIISLPASSSSAAAQTPAPDVSYLLSADLNLYMPTAQVTGVTEDSDNYYVAYTLSTIALVGNIWEETTEDQSMTISKSQLGAYRDLGLYVASQLQGRTAQELSYLKRVQSLAQASVSGTQTASAYAGLIGKTLNADSTAIPGYAAVVQNPLPQIASAPTLPTSVTQPSPQPVISIPEAQPVTEASSTDSASTSSGDPATGADDASSTTASQGLTSTSTGTVIVQTPLQESSQTNNASTTASDATTTTAQ